MMEIKNWKLVQAKEHIKIIHEDSIEFIDKILSENSLPIKFNQHLNRSESFIDWDMMKLHFLLFFDYEGSEEEVKVRLQKSNISKTDFLILTYGRGEPAIKVPTQIFINEWEDYVASALYQTLIMDEEKSLIIEVTRDYYMHSNFSI